MRPWNILAVVSGGTRLPNVERFSRGSRRCRWCRRHFRSRPGSTTRALVRYTSPATKTINLFCIHKNRSLLITVEKRCGLPRSRRVGFRRVLESTGRRQVRTSWSGSRCSCAQALNYFRLYKRRINRDSSSFVWRLVYKERLLVVEVTSLRREGV